MGEVGEAFESGAMLFAREKCTYDVCLMLPGITHELDPAWDNTRVVVVVVVVVVVAVVCGGVWWCVVVVWPGEVECDGVGLCVVVVWW